MVKIVRSLIAVMGTAALLFGGSCAEAQTPAATNEAPATTLPPWPTTQERPVNPTGLSEPSPYGWHTDFIGTLRGDFDASFGIKFWPDRFHFRDLVFGGTVELAPGWRVRGMLRRREGDQKFFQLDTEEAYLEGFNQYRGRTFDGGVDLKLGRSRYLHFPYPDAIAQFDTVTHIDDITFGIGPTDYRNFLLEGEVAHHNGFGAHFTGLADFIDQHRAHVLEAYAFYRSDFWRSWHIEGRIGDIAVREFPLTRGGEPGYNMYLGKQLGEFNVGLLYERKHASPEYTGIMVQFRPTKITRALGHVSLDYSRAPEGFTAQIPLLHARLNESRFVRSGDILVGEVRAVRLRTLWQQGYVRNQYEHRLESWGETSDPKLHCVVTEEPWYLQTEALVSPHLIPDASWEHDRIGPAQFVQRVTYRYYRPKPRPRDNTGT